MAPLSPGRILVHRYKVRYDSFPNDQWVDNPRCRCNKNRSILGIDPHYDAVRPDDSFQNARTLVCCSCLG